MIDRESIKTLVLIKLGGSLITRKDKPFTERPDTIRRLALEIHEARLASDFSLIIGHGGGSYPHPPASAFKTHKGIVDERSVEGIARVQDAASRLNRIVVGELVEAGENAMTIQPSSCCIAKGGRIVEMYARPIEMLLEHCMVPVLYGDVGMDVAQGCSVLSTEEIFNFLIEHHTDPEERDVRVVNCGRVDGVYTANPDLDGSAELIEEITPENIERFRKGLTGAAGIDVTGGMRQKVDAMLELARAGVISEIVNADRPGILKRCLMGETGLGTMVRG